MSPAFSVVRGECAAARSWARIRAASSVERERLGEVVDCPGVETGDAMLDFAERGQDDDGQSRLWLVQRREDVETAASGKHQVEHDQIHVLVLCRLPRR